MGRKKYDGVYKGDDGIYWAYFNGRKRTPNRQGVAWDMYHELKDEDDRARIAAGEGSLGHEEVIVLRGVPGSGKTTWARDFMAERPWYKRVNRDLLRQMLDFGEYGANKEKFIIAMRDQIIRECLEQGYSVVVDDTNLKERDIREITSAARAYNRVIGIERTVALPVRIIDFDTPLAECIQRDALREKPVGADRIRVMWYSYRPIDSDEELAELRAAKKRLEAID